MCHLALIAPLHISAKFMMFDKEADFRKKILIRPLTSIAKKRELVHLIFHLKHCVP